MDNKFEAFALWYYDFLKNLDKYTELQRIQTSNRVLLSNDYETREFIKDEWVKKVEELYNEIKEYINTDGDSAGLTVFQMIKDFTKFLEVVTQVFMYPNNEENSFHVFYSGKDKKDLGLQVIPMGFDIKYTFIFRETNVAVPDESYNFLTSFIEKKEEPTVELMELHIDRKNIGGNNDVMNFITLYAPEEHLKTPEEKTLVSVVFSMTKNMISDCIDDILNNYISKCALQDDIKIRKVLENDL